MLNSLRISIVLVSLLMSAQLSAQTIKLATLAPEGSQWVSEMRAGAKLIGERTDGRVKLKLYAGGVMGNDKKVLRKIRIGQLQGAYFTANSLSNVYPDINIYGMPFLFRNEEEVRHVRARLDQQLEDGLRDVGYETFGFAGGGFAQFLSNTPVTSLKEIEKQKVWIPEGDTISYRAMQALGLSPVTLPLTDVLTGLQSGLVDIVGSPPVAALVMQWHTKVKYMTKLPLLYTMGYVAIDNKAFARISAEDQKIVREVLADVNQTMDEANLVDNQKAVAALGNAGIKFVEPSVEAVESWRREILVANKAMARDGLVSEKLLADVLADLDAFREQSKNVAQQAAN